ncbi:MAG TPA: Hsp20/alpha crystallin family protein [Candidatus Paceibacterota bacterium]|nr:Hsp20/alpha crystallin family protein [Candidatus Paceibacterota bacterium]
MNQNDDYYFEQLASGKEQPEVEAELARANAGAVSPSRPRLRTKRAGSEWADAEPEGQLTVDVYQTPDEIVVESAIAGVHPDDLDITATIDSVSIRGTRSHEKPVQDEDYLYQECYWGRFARTIILPQEVEPEGAEVTFKNGILSVHLPKASKKKTRKLQVRID